MLFIFVVERLALNIKNAKLKGINFSAENVQKEFIIAHYADDKALLLKD
jgi:hypothetical protein